MKKILLLALLVGTFGFAQSKSVDNAVNKTAKTTEHALDKGVEAVKSFVPSKQTGNAVKDGVSTFYGDIKDGTTTVYSDVKDAVKTLTPEARDLLSKTAKKLEKTTNQVWDILVRQQRVWSICYLILTLGSIALWCRFYYQYDKMQTDLNEAGEEKDSHCTLACLLFILACISTGFSSYHFVDMVTGFYNPEFGAMKNIVQFYKSVQ